MLIVSVTLLVAFNYFSSLLYRFHHLDGLVKYKYKEFDFLYHPFLLFLDFG